MKVVMRVGTSIIIIFLITVFLLLNLQLFFKEQFPSIFGLTPLNVLSGSMEPTFKVGDVLLIRKVPIHSIQHNDIITYKKDGKSLVTHRVVSIDNQGNERIFRTKGDANTGTDRQIVHSEQVIGKVIIIIPSLGLVSAYFTSFPGLISVVVLLFSITTIRKLRNHERTHNDQNKLS
ncbi:signal peptidase I [Bacillus andreraoultii]|uniref:signal peptidase I n=1 Tax=Bacillus andreraoultii TaxID=1499685 RepID=UPI00067F3A5A|nr:signal peptidase I [Bacillus andreraoultii]